MKVASLAPLACLVTAVSAQYFSEGWKPGQPATPTAEAYRPQFTSETQGGAGAKQAAPKQGFLDALVQGPISSLLGKAGINVTDSLEAAQARAELWDSRIPLIHDDNYDELIVQEQLTAQEEKDRVWFMIISTTAGQQQQGGISRIVDREFDTA